MYYFLLNEGYSTHFLEATKQFPEICYKMLVPIEIPDKETIVSQLKKKYNIQPNEVKYIFI